MTRLELDSRIAPFFNGPDAFEQILAIDGEPYRQFANRRTVRVELGRGGYFFKIHLGVGWREIGKCLFSFRLPVLGAENERHAIRCLEEIGIPTMAIAGFGMRGWNPAKRQSFLITEELADTVSLEDFCRDWPDSPPAPALKFALIDQVAWIAKQLHESGMNHRDFYLCHFLLASASLPPRTPNQVLLYLIDLHRVQNRPRVPRRWLVKDLAGLYFSSMDLNLNRRDIFRFLKGYFQKPLAKILDEQQGLLESVRRRAVKLYRKEHNREPAHPFQ
ncbi:MAG TPA: lipopolysaccharide core heptose(I) kinase RfaP [Desulfuromonadales bacterium]|nr:lipopolysaccharide core heptose(I) kinase RfaP [Desulfuromonadales bacterium]